MSSAYFGLGESSKGYTKWEECLLKIINYYKNEAENDSYNSTPFRKMAETYLTLADGFFSKYVKYYEKMIESYRQALRIEPESTEIWIKIGLAYKTLGIYNWFFGNVIDHDSYCRALDCFCAYGIA